MTIQQKKQILDQNFTTNYNDYLTIIKKITVNRKRHLDINPEEILTIIYQNIEKRLDSINESFFITNDAFRSVYIQTLQSQIHWSVSDIQSYKNQFYLPFNEIHDGEDGSELDVLNSDRTINGERVIQEFDEEIDDMDNKFNFLYDEYPNLIKNIIDERTYDLIITQQKYTNTKFNQATGVDLTSSRKLLSKFKNKIRFAYDNINKIKDKPSLNIIAELHPSINLNLVTTIALIEQYNPTIEIKVVKGYISSKEQNDLLKQGLCSLKPNQSTHKYGLGFDIECYQNNEQIETTFSIIHNFKINGFNYIRENHFEFTNGMTINEIQAKYKAKDFISKDVKWIRL